MLSEVRWAPSVSAACIYAADCVRRGITLVDPALADALREPTDHLVADIEELGADPAVCFAHLAPLSVQLDSNRELAAAALTKTLGGARAAQLREFFAGRIADVEQAMTRMVPKLADELPLRIEPIRLQWEARGPGLMSELGRLTESELIAERADVALVQPVCGGGGRAYPRYNVVLFEALLADPLPALPETLRLGWLLAQLQLDLPHYHDRLTPAQLDGAAPLALAMAALVAGENVELARCDEPTVATALEHWRAADPKQAPELLAWWEEYTQSRPPWPVAVAALEQLQQRRDEAPQDAAESEAALSPGSE